MRDIEKIYRLVFRKEVIWYMLCMGLIIMLHTPLEALLSNTVIKYLFSGVESAWYNDILFTIAIVLVVFYTLYRWRKYTPSVNLSVIMVFASLTYILYRYQETPWAFVSTVSWYSIKYTDIILIITVCQLVLLAKRIPTSATSSGSFYDDNPLGINGNDTLGYDSYAKQIAQRLLQSNFKRSFAIGINGKWGMGKTSFLDLIKRKATGTDIISIEFNPWNTHSPKAIIKDFFDSVQEGIRPYHSSLSRLLVQYSKGTIYQFTLNRFF